MKTLRTYLLSVLTLLFVGNIFFLSSTGFGRVGMSLFVTENHELGSSSLDFERGNVVHVLNDPATILKDFTDHAPEKKKADENYAEALHTQRTTLDTENDEPFTASTESEKHVSLRPVSIENDETPKEAMRTEKTAPDTERNEEIATSDERNIDANPPSVAVEDSEEEVHSDELALDSEYDDRFTASVENEKDASQRTAPAEDNENSTEQTHVEKTSPNTEQDGWSAPADKQDSSDDSEKCLSYILYDKPIKTGSTAISMGIRRFLANHGEFDHPCQNPVCSDKARKICAGTHAKEHLLSHLTISDKTFYCLKSMGYYSVTSIRDPRARWRSSYFYNAKKNGTHYGIMPTASYSDFLKKYPRCALLHYYDGEGSRCSDSDEAKVMARIDRIVARFDEVIDLDERPDGPVHRVIQEYIKEVNVAGKEVSDVVQKPNEESLEYEMRLYNALRNKRKAGASGRVLCHI